MFNKKSPDARRGFFIKQFIFCINHNQDHPVTQILTTMYKTATLLITLLSALLCQFTYSQNVPTVTLSSSSLAGFTTAVGTPSAQQLVQVSGSGLTGNVTATAPTGFEISWTSGNSFATSITLTQSSGIFTNVPLYVRLTGAALGSVSGNVVVSSTGATNQLLAVTGTVTAAPTPNPASVLTSISPTSGPGGTQMLINFYGTGFVPGATVSFQAGSSNITANYVSSTQLTALVLLPSVATPLVSYFYASNPPPGGGGSGGMKFFTVNPSPPTITGFSPTSGAPGTLVTIRGTNLYVPSGSTAIFFGGTPAAIAQRVPSSTEYYTVVPAGATTGFITLTNSNGGAVSPTQFVVPTAQPPFFEDFEQGTKTSYATASVQLPSGGWTFAESLIGTTAGADKFNGTKSSRLRGGGFLEMDTDKPNGAGIVTVSAANYSTETGASFVPEISTDGGVTYNSLLGNTSPPILTSTLTQYSFTANRTGNVRFRFSSTNTTAATNPRINIDDIGITDYSVLHTQTIQALPNLQIFPNPASDQLVIEGIGNAQVSLYDLLGRNVLAPIQLIKGQPLALPTSLPTGSYLLHVQNKEGQRIVRIIKK
ncbi:IPT/TIG domain-containing protein [Microvirga sp. STR05]|uniref:IPT/TIG domain-containing protein n=1 Tax=Hymenobacter duratus TaxID=2771356 RepID=A0ABR8JJ79_9BACT|nr:IPT/TIG domain-containing protein [Hymenobacter duratus]MBD2715880.1 IPT/TIG domain-containing protein [Hymenobacter duratus]MBR7950791.1 IPT/TIG domain-containing protein [Microvirga sp. STR05]